MNAEPTILQATDRETVSGARRLGMGALAMYEPDNPWHDVYNNHKVEGLRLEMMAVKYARDENGDLIDRTDGIPGYVTATATPDDYDELELIYTLEIGLMITLSGEHDLESEYIQKTVREAFPPVDYEFSPGDWRKRTR